MRGLPLLVLAFVLVGCADPSPSGRLPLRTATGVPRDPEVFRGEVVDLGCFLRQGARGEAHRACAQACLKRGVPAGLITDDGEIHLLVPDLSVEGKEVPDLSFFAADRCEVRGKILRRGPHFFGVLVESIVRIPPALAP